MKKLEQIDYPEMVRESLGSTNLCRKIYNLKVGEGVKISNFPSYREMKGLTECVKPHFFQNTVVGARNILRIVIDEKNLTYTIRRVA